MFNWLLDCVFPKRCIGCGQWDCYLCVQCLKTVNSASLHRNTYTQTTGIQYLFFLNTYQDHPLLQKAIHELKYGFIKELGIVLGKELAKHVPHHYDYVIPIPLHKRRLRERGFNQSAIIAKQLSIPLLPGLHRKHYTTPQAQLNREQRLTNVQQAFAIVSNFSIQLHGAHILLVDDVYTTGTTMNTCATLLYQFGAQHVDGAVLALD